MMQEVNQKYNVLLYYKYVEIEDPEEIQKWQMDLCKSLNLTGRILIGKEGLNGTVSGSPEDIEKYKQATWNHPLFNDMEFKESGSDFDPLYGKLRIKVKEEIVALNTKADPKNGGKHISPKEFKEMMEKDDTIVLDARNDYEFKIGKFKGAVTLPIRNFREFPEAIKEIEEHKDKKVLMYCTGGIRCERASTVLKEKGFKNVYQLHGGIVNYGKEFPEDDSFEGTCFVFDDRFKIPVNKNPKLISDCGTCGKKDDTIRNCCNAECNKLIIQCNECYKEERGACSSECKKKDRKLLQNNL